MISRGHLTHMSILHQSCITIQFNQNQNSYHFAYFNCFLEEEKISFGLSGFAHLIFWVFFENALF